MSTNEMKPTPGPVHVPKAPFCVVMAADGFPLCDTHSIHRTLPEYQANARIIADAFNIYHETGLTPRQLAEQREELKRTIHEVEPVLAEFEDDMPEEIDKLKWALSKLRATGK